MAKSIWLFGVIVYLCVFFTPALGGEKADEFLLWGTGAKAIATGQACMGVADDADAMYYNPAGLVNIRSEQITTVYSSQSDFDMSTLAVKYTGGKKRDMSYGVGFLYLRVGDIPKTQTVNDRPSVLGSISASNYALTFSGAKVISENKSVGATLKLTNQKIPKSYSGIGVDIGYLERRNNLSFGVALQNVLSKFSGDASYPLTLKTGIAYTLTKEKTEKLPVEEIKISLDRHKQEKYDETYHIGLDAKLSELTSIRLGMDDGNFTAGIGVKLTTYQVDCAYSKNSLGDNMRISISSPISLKR